MKINWFPGHMSKALGEIKREINKTDVVIYCLDSRAPISSINPSLDRMARDKKILYVFNKIDLADEKRVKEIASRYKSARENYCFLNSTLSGASKIIRSKILALSKDKIEKFKAKGIKTVVRAIVVGVPNSGKSTLTNNLCGKSKAITGNKAGVTKSIQWLPVGDNIELCDTPGTLYPNLENQEIAKKLVFIGSIKDEIIVDTIELAEELLKMLNKKYPTFVENRYGENATIESIAEKRAYKISGGELDYERTANAIIDDFRKGKLGRITLD